MLGSASISSYMLCINDFSVPISFYKGFSCRQKKVASNQEKAIIRGIKPCLLAVTASEGFQGITPLLNLSQFSRILFLVNFILGNQKNRKRKAHHALIGFWEIIRLSNITRRVQLYPVVCTCSPARR